MYVASDQTRHRRAGLLDAADQRVEATRQIRERLPKTEVLIFSIHDEEIVITELLKAGGRAYVLKSDFKRDLINAVESLAAHKPFLPARSVRRCSMRS